MSKQLFTENVFHKILSLIIKGKTDTLLNKFKDDPETARKIKVLDKKVKDLRSTGDDIVKRLQKKYKGTEYEFLFK